MKRERQWDMFDVAIGACELDDYLNQRYSESDLQSKFWVEPSDTMDELRPPEKGSKEQVVIPVQGPSVTPAELPAPVSSEPLPTRPPWESATPQAEALPSRPSWERPAAESTAPPQPVARPVPVAPPAPAVAPPPERPSPAPVAPAAEAPPWSRPAPAPPPEPVEQTPAPPIAPPAAPSMEELLARFHQAAQAYEERSKDAEESSDE